VYNSEVNSLGWRTRGAAAATATNWMGGFIVTQFTKIGVDTLHWRFYLSMSTSSTSHGTSTNLSTVFAIICYSYFPIVFCLYPETSRRTLEDMDEIFIQNSSAFVFSNKSLTSRERPQLFVDAEARRVEDGATSKVAEVDIKSPQVSTHVERMA
jgi:hypothetical protein